MEESIKKAEELIQETEMTLARIQNDVSLDDFGMEKIDGRRGKKLGFDHVRHLPSPRNIIENDVFNLKKGHSIRDDKIDEINQKIELYKLELERESTKARTTTNREDPPRAKRTQSDGTLSQKSIPKASNVTEDLKSKLKQTQEIVNRGIQTARELNETVEGLRSGRQQKSIDEEISGNKFDRLATSESRSTIKTVETKRCKRCNAEITRKSKDRKRDENVLVTNIRRADSSSPRRRQKLNYQQLPSLTIHGDLSCQRIPSVEILPGKPPRIPIRVNAAYETFSHEEIIRERFDKEMGSDSGRRAKSVECMNCGKVMRVTGKTARSDEIDELLKMCNYNVFDPRIDEFVGRISGELDDLVEEEKAPSAGGESPKSAPAESPKMYRRMRISDLSSELTRRYREKAAELEIDHLEFEGIVRELMDEIDESREFFKTRETGKKLSVTTPVLLSYTGSGEEADDGRNAVLRPNRQRKIKLPSRVIRKKLEKKELETNCKLISSASPVKVSEPTRTAENKPEMQKKDPSKRKATKPIKPVESKPSPPPPEPVKVVEEANTVSDYESDFEEDSVEEEKEPEPIHRFPTKLSTICEVESELEKKLSDLTVTEPKKSADEKKQPVIGTSSDEDDTRKLLTRVNRELREMQSIPARRPETVDGSLKEVLNALKDQFERTEILADRLTESIKEVKKSDEVDVINLRDFAMVNNMQRPRKSPEIFPSRSRDKSISNGKNDSRSFSPIGNIQGSVSLGKSYSEGEISEQEIFPTIRSSPSIGEVINEIHSDGSLSEEKSLLKFL